MRMIFVLLFVGLLLVAGCPQEEVVEVPVEPEPEPIPAPKPAPEPEPETITIGYVGPLTGEHAAEGTEALNALELAASELSNKDYVYEIAEQDSQCTSEGAASALESLADFRNVKIIIGGICPAEVDGMAAELEPKGAVLISLATGNSESPYAMNFAGSPELIGQELAQFCKDNSLLRTMVVTDGSAEAIKKKDLFDAAAKLLGLSTQPAQTYNDKFKSTVSVIKGYQPEVVLVFTSDGATAATIVNELKVGGVKAQIIGDENTISSAALSAMGENSEGVYAILPEFDETDPAASYFMNSYISQYGAPSNQVLVADARNALYLLDQAEQMYYYKATPEDVKSYWENLESWAGMGATLSFENGDRVASFRMVKVENGAPVSR